MDPGPLSEFLLAPALCLAETTNVAAEALTDVHDRPTTPLSAINLQTMSDIER